MIDNAKNIIESLLFIAEKPLKIEHFKKVLPLETKEIRGYLNDLFEEYENRRGGFYLNEVAGGFQLRTRPECKKWINRMKQSNPFKITKATLETLAIVAYKQPAIRSDVEYIRGVDSGSTLRLLLDKKLIKVAGRKEIPGRPLIYKTTSHFLEIFNLKSIKDLPTLEEFDKLGENIEKDSLNKIDNKEETDTIHTDNETKPLNHDEFVYESGNNKISEFNTSYPLVIPESSTREEVNEVVIENSSEKKTQ